MRVPACTALPHADGSSAGDSASACSVTPLSVESKKKTKKQAKKNGNTVNNNLTTTNHPNQTQTHLRINSRGSPALLRGDRTEQH